MRVSMVNSDIGVGAMGLNSLTFWLTKKHSFSQHGLEALIWRGKPKQKKFSRLGWRESNHACIVFAPERTELENL